MELLILLRLVKVNCVCTQLFIYVIIIITSKLIQNVLQVAYTKSKHITILITNVL